MIYKTNHYKISILTEGGAKRLGRRGRARLARLGGVAAVCAALWLACGVAPARAEKVEQLKPTGYVNDFANVLDARAREQITALCAEVDQKARAQITVVTIRSLEGVPASDFANRLYKQWGVGYKGDDRGVLFLLAIGDHKYWVEVGYALEPILPDGKVGGFGREMQPLLRQGAYGQAAFLFTGRIAGVIAQDRGVTLGTRVPAAQGRGSGSRGNRSLVPFALLGIVLFILWIIEWFQARFSRGGRGRPARYGGGWWMMGGTGGWGGGGFGAGGGFGGFGGGSSGGGGAGGDW